jgi:hypothetical protein
MPFHTFRVYLTRERALVIAISLSVTILFFLAFLVSPLSHVHFLRHDCTVVESKIIPRYCCQEICNSCQEAFVNTPLCTSLIQRTHLEKNISQCLVGERKFCADEGARCQKGYHCCISAPFYYDPLDSSKYYYICTRSVRNRSCHLHCPSCWTSRIIYSFESQGSIRNVTHVIEHDRKSDEKQARKDVNDSPLYSHRYCWVNPNNSQNVLISRETYWWRILIACLLATPATIVLLIVCSEWLIDVCSEFSFYHSPEEQSNLLENGNTYQRNNDQHHDQPPPYSIHH